MSSYADFLAAKTQRVPTIGPATQPGDVHPMLHPWQKEIVAWAVRKGRAALWEDTGLGKTFQQLEWARLSGERTLILAPLAVTRQTVREAEKIGLNVRYVRTEDDAQGPGIWITNYEMADRFNADNLDAVVLDEASILKQSDGKTRTRLIQQFANVKHRLACTATPAPNDIEELTNQAEFLGVMPRAEMLAAYFIHDQNGWRLKGHARDPMYRWMATWAVALRRPSDIGYPDTGYDLPPLRIEPHTLAVDVTPDDQLFATDLGGIGGRAKVRKLTLDARVGRAVDLVHAEPTEPWLLWCGLNDEQTALQRELGDMAFSVTGSQSPEEKVEKLYAWLNGERPVLLSKVSIFGFGMNFQHCARMAFVGLSDSYEQYYQAIRRCYRYGQQREVHAHVILSELEGQIASNIARKEADAASHTAALVESMRAAREASAA